MSTVSVLLPYRDAAPTIDEALASVVSQRGLLASVEVIAIDDGSHDDGPHRVAQRARRLADGVDVRVVMISTGGVGIARALAAGLEVASGKLIARMDADDVSLPDRFARQLDALAASPALAAVGTRVEVFTGTDTGATAATVGDGLGRYVAWQNGLVTPEEHARQLFVEAPLCHPSVLLRREALEAVGGWRDVPWPEDYDLWLRLDAAGWGLAKVPEVLLRWRHRPGRATFSDPRCAPERLLDAKAPHLARRLLGLGRPVAVWGAGKTGKRVARALEPHGVTAARFFDIDPRKVGNRARGAPIVDPTDLLDGPARDLPAGGRPGPWTVVVAVGEPGARDIVRSRLDLAGFVEGRDYLCAA